MSSIIIHPGHHGHAERTLFGFRTAEHPKLDAFQNAVSALATIIAATCVTALALVTLAEIIMREFFHHPLGWNISLTEKYLLPGLDFFGLVAAYRTGSHIAVETVFSKFPGTAQKLLLILIHAGVTALMLALAFAGWNQTWLAFSLDQAVLPGMADLPAPDWTFRIIVPLAAILCAVLAAIDLFRELTSPWDRPYTDYEPGEGI